MAAYNDSFANGDFSKKIEQILQYEKKCILCPQECGVDRTQDTGYCVTNIDVPVAEFLVHMGEEQVISGSAGTGAIFLSNCNLSCVFCQNSEVSQCACGELANKNELAHIMLRLQDKGCHSIDWVSPSHCVNTLIQALYIAVQDGLQIPIVYNSGGYDNELALSFLDGLIDIYMPDIKWSNNNVAKQYSDVSNYVEYNRSALKIMHDQVGDLVVSGGVANRGLLLRYLVLPNQVNDTNEIADWIKDNLGTNTYISILTEYFPFYNASEYPGINRHPNDEEILEVIECFEGKGFTRLEYNI